MNYLDLLLVSFLKPLFWVAAVILVVVFVLLDKKIAYVVVFAVVAILSYGLYLFINPENKD